MTEQLKMGGGKNGGPVECLGMTFPSDDARREHFLKLLADKLREPEFRAQEGFPVGSDEAILEMSDPPYFTACPNPWFSEFAISANTSRAAHETYSKEPFAADVSEGKNDPVYNAHSYHTKVPYKAIIRYILHYTSPGDIVYDGFCGTGMTGVAATLCGNREIVASLGYRIDEAGNILAPEQEDGRVRWANVSKLGERKALLVDLSPAATFISRIYNTPIDEITFKRETEEILDQVEKKFGWMYETRHGSGEAKGRVNYTVWSDVFTCKECAGEVVFWDEAVDTEGGQVRDVFPCPHCSAELTKRRLERSFSTSFDQVLGTTVSQANQTPVLINYSFGGKRFEKRPDSEDLSKIKKISEASINAWVPSDRLPEGGETRRNDPMGITHVHHFFTPRSLTLFSEIFSRAKSSFSTLALLGGYTVGLKTARFLPLRWIQKDTGPMKPHTAGTLYVPSISGEQNWLNIFRSRAQATVRGAPAIRRLGNTLISTGSASQQSIPDASIDYIFLDPPFGSNLAYSELNFLWESWLKVHTCVSAEAVENKSRGQDLDAYRRAMSRCFAEAYRVLKPGRWMTVEFSNTKASVWNAIQIALQEAGFVVANVSALDKKQGTFKSVNNKTSVKQDLVISAYKPNGGLEERFLNSKNYQESIWDFVQSHLSYLPTVRSKGSQLDFVSERDPRIIFDRMVSWFVRHSVPVPISSQEFQGELTRRYPERDGMVFLPEQVAEYDKARAAMNEGPQLELFVSDERSAIDWITNQLRKRPSTYQELQPEFFGQVGAGWKKHEEKPELSALLEDNFLRFDGNGDVPSQIHSYLSTNFKDLRGLEKEDPRLKAKAKDRWYVPDPNKAKDLEQKRERSLLKEFEAYKTANKRQLKESRLEVLRAGFKTAWAAKDYKTIIGIAEKLPDATLQEDEKLLLWYDQALTRTEADA